MEIIKGFKAWVHTITSTKSIVFMISVIIPTYNRKKELLRSLDSVRNQTFRDIEIIVVDDGSTDATESAATAIRDERIRYIKHEKNRGGGAARNTGISNARGKLDTVR